MKRQVSVVALTIVALATLILAGCKSGGMAVTKHGQFMKININGPDALADGAEDNIDVVIGNRGVRNIEDVLVDVELPPQLVVLGQTADRGVDVSHDPGSANYHFSFNKLQPAEDTHIRFRVRTAFGTVRQTDSVKVTAWQKDLQGDKLVETSVIRLRS